MRLFRNSKRKDKLSFVSSEGIYDEQSTTESTLLDSSGSSAGRLIGSSSDALISEYAREVDHPCKDEKAGSSKQADTLISSEDPSLDVIKEIITGARPEILSMHISESHSSRDVLPSMPRNRSRRRGGAAVEKCGYDVAGSSTASAAAEAAAAAAVAELGSSDDDYNDTNKNETDRYGCGNTDENTTNSSSIYCERDPMPTKPVEPYCGDESMSEFDEDMCGYGYAVPDSAERSEDVRASDQQPAMPAKRRGSGVGLGSLEDDLGYGDATPDLASKVEEDKYGYGYAVPDCSRSHSMDELPVLRRAKDQAPSKPSRGRGARQSAPLSGAPTMPVRGAPSMPVRDAPTMPFRDAPSMPVRGAPTDAPTMPVRARRSTMQFGCDLEEKTEEPEYVPKRRRSITFAETSNVKEVEPVVALADKPEDLWFQKKDYAEFKETIRTVVEKTRRGDAAMVEELRGLEGYLEQPRTRIRKDRAKESVLFSQYGDQRWSDNVDTHEETARRYRRTSLESKNKAAERAAQDVADIEKYLESTRRTIRRQSV